MKKFNFKRFLALSMATVMCLGSSMAVLADGDDNTSTSASTANVLAYNVDTVVVPTSLKIALNPSGYSFTPGYDKANITKFADNTTYYTETSGAYTKVASSETFDEEKTYYTARASVSDQVISLNYGIANKATSDKVVSVKLSVSQGTTTDNPIVFVNSADEVTNAEKGELKLYLEAVPASVEPTVYSTYAYTKFTGTSFDDKTEYYTRSADKFTEKEDSVTEPQDDVTYYTQASASEIGVAITGAELADAKMNKSTETVSLNASTDTKSAENTISFKLDKATYGLKDGKVIDFNTDQTTLKEILEMTELGDATAFTISGKINTNADWTKADVKSITITPTYTFATADGSETAVDGTYKRVTTLADAKSAAKAEIAALVTAEDYDDVPDSVNDAVVSANEAIDECTAISGDDGLTSVTAAQKVLVEQAIEAAKTPTLNLEEGKTTKLTIKTDKSYIDNIARKSNSAKISTDRYTYAQSDPAGTLTITFDGTFNTNNIAAIGAGKTETFTITFGDNSTVDFNVVTP